MDAGTNLVQAYLHVNGYFSAIDYPLLESRHGKRHADLYDPALSWLSLLQKCELTATHNRRPKS